MVSFGTMSSGRGQLYTIDGGDNTDDVVGGLLQQVSMDSVQEFEVVTARLNAEYSRAGGGAIRIITKSGTNEFRGSVFEFFRDKSLNAETQAEKDAGTGKGPFRRHQFGGNIGGPIVKDKAFFFFTYERIQEDLSDSLPATRGRGSLQSRVSRGARRARNHRAAVPPELPHRQIHPAVESQQSPGRALCLRGQRP